MATNAPTIAHLKLVPPNTAVFGWYFELGVTLRYIYENRRRLSLSTSDIERLVNNIHGNVIQLSPKYSGGSMPYINMKVQWDQTKKDPLPWMWRLVYKEVHAQEVRLRQARQTQLQQTVRAVGAMKIWPFVQLQAELQRVLAADTAENQEIDAAPSHQSKEDHETKEQEDDETEEQEEDQEESEEIEEDDAGDVDQDVHLFYRRGIDTSPPDGMGAWNVAGEHHPYAYDDGTADEDWDANDPDAYLYKDNSTQKKSSRSAAMIDLTGDEDAQPSISHTTTRRHPTSNRSYASTVVYHAAQHAAPASQQTAGSAWGMVQPYQPSSRQPSQLQLSQPPRARMQQTAPRMQQYSASNSQQAPNWVDQYILGNATSAPPSSPVQTPYPGGGNPGQYAGSSHSQNGSSFRGHGNGGNGQGGYR